MKKVRDTDLAVRGIKINVKNPVRKIIATVRNTSYNQFRVCSGAVESRNVVAGNSTPAEYREVFKLKAAVIPNRALETKELRRIRESEDIEDIRRLLELHGNNLTEEQGGSESDDGYLVTGVDASKLYKEFYQVHYDFLKDLVERMSLQ